MNLNKDTILRGAPHLIIAYAPHSLQCARDMTGALMVGYPMVQYKTLVERPNIKVDFL